MLQHKDIDNNCVYNNNPITSEARYKPVAREENSVLTNSPQVNDRLNRCEARAPCLDGLQTVNSDIKCLLNCDNIDQFVYDVNERQVRDCYEKVSFQSDLPQMIPYVYEDYKIGGVPVQLNPAAWFYELQYENDGYLKSYIQKGVLGGFDIIDDPSLVTGYDSSNYSSVLFDPAYSYIDTLIRDEIDKGKYLVVNEKPKCIHALGAVKKSDSTYRPITDCSQPDNGSINNFMETTHQKFVYNSVDLVTKMMRPGIFSSTVDISAAYRAIPINPRHRTYQGLRWSVDGQLKYLVDTHLCFGARCAPFIFTQIGNFINRCLIRRGYCTVLNYIDDFICFGNSFDECQQVQMTLINLLRRLGFQISWKKCSSPSTYTKYLGLYFDSVNMQVKLPDEKLNRLFTELQFFEGRHRATKRQLQKLCGVLSHCACVVHGGRIFSKRINLLLKGIHSNKRIRLGEGFNQDLRWWKDFAMFFNGTASVIKYNYGAGPWFATDASNTGYGVFTSGDWLGGFFNELANIRPVFCDNHMGHNHWENVTLPLIDSDDNNINFRELVPVYLAIIRYAPSCINTQVVAFSDNLQVVHAVNKGTSCNASSMNLLRCIFWLCVQYNVSLIARYIPGKFNIIPDLLSRQKEKKHQQALMNFDLCCRYTERG